MPKRVLILSAIAVVALVVVGYLVFAQISDLQEQIAGLDRALSETEQQLATTEARAVAATEAAVAATARAEQAESEAAAAQVRADMATDEANEAAARAERATVDREQAEQERSAAEQARDEAMAESYAAQIAAAQAREEARAAQEEAEAIRRQREIELSRMQEALDNIVETRRTAIGIVLNLGSDRIEFEFDKAELRPEERELLARIAGVLLATADQGYAIQVFGHTDDVGSEEYNLGLSERRAEAVRSYLVESGVNPEIITMQGMGKSMPLVEETTVEARARNRRVEIAIIDTMIEYRGRGR